MNYPMVSARKFRRTPIPAHRLAFILHYGHDPKGHVCHTCGNNMCCNPNHLYSGTAKTNHDDSVRHGTHKPIPHREGEAVHNAKLTIETVLFARHAFPLLKRPHKGTLAALLGISITHLRRIVRGDGWGHIKG